MKLADALTPLTVEDLKTRYFGKRPVVRVPRSGNPLRGLVTIAELEARLNDGCASLTNLAIIGPDGGKLPRDQIYCPQPVPAWNREFLRKAQVHRLLEQGHSFVLHNMTHVNPRVAELVEDIERVFENFQADAHLYVSPRAGSRSYNVHCDLPQHKLYFQVLGTTEWTIYRGSHPKRALSAEEAERHLEVDIQATLTPGSFLYMPPGVFHRARNPHGPRISISIPFHPIAGTFQVDRHHVPLAAIMARDVGE